MHFLKIEQSLQVVQIPLLEHEFRVVVLSYFTLLLNGLVFFLFPGKHYCKTQKACSHSPSFWGKKPVRFSWRKESYHCINTFQPT